MLLGVKLESGSSSKGGKPNCITYWKRHYRKCLASTGFCFGYGKDGHRVKDCPTIAARGKEGKQVPPSALVDVALKGNCFFSLWSKGSKASSDDEDVGKFYYSIFVL